MRGTLIRQCVEFTPHKVTIFLWERLLFPKKGHY